MKTNPIGTIRGLGFHVPEKILTNKDLEKIVDTSDEWITTRTGISQRHVAAEGEAVSDLALPAARQALEDAGMEADELTHIIVASCTPDAMTPTSACMLEHKLGLSGKMALDVNAACSGFVYALDVARGIVCLHPDARVLVVGAEVLTSRVNWEDRATCVLFGDGAGAAVVTGETDKPGGRILDIILSSDGSLGELLKISGGGSSDPYRLGHAVGDNHFVRMQGREVFKHAVRSMEAVSRKIMDKNGLTLENADLFITHQANNRIIEALGKKLEFPEEKVFANVHRYGNTSAASVPIAMAEARQSGQLKDGDLLLIAAFGGGFTWGSALIQF